MPPTLTSDPLADVADLAALTGRDLTDPVLSLALSRASARFRSAVRSTVTRVDDDEVTLEGDGSRSLLLPDVPVLSVTSVTAGGETVPGYRWFRDGRLRRLPGWPGWPDDRVTVVYSHGHDPVPADIVEVVLHAAQAILATQPGVQTMAIGGQSVTFERAGVTGAWSVAVDRYRIGWSERP